jgi:hypothetical protein
MFEQTNERLSSRDSDTLTNMTSILSKISVKFDAVTLPPKKISIGNRFMLPMEERTSGCEQFLPLFLRLSRIDSSSEDGEDELETFHESMLMDPNQHSFLEHSHDEDRIMEIQDIEAPREGPRFSTFGVAPFETIDPLLDIAQAHNDDYDDDREEAYERGAGIMEGINFIDDDDDGLMMYAPLQCCLYHLQRLMLVKKWNRMSHIISNKTINLKK